MSKDPTKSRPAIALEDRAEIGERMFSPSVARNRDAIRKVFLDHMPSSGAVLEVGGGTGEHAEYLARALPDIQWHSGDLDPASRSSIAAWIAHAELPNLLGPHAIDVTADDWGLEQREFDGVVSVNMIHIAPFAAANGLFSGAEQLLRPSGKLFLYGPFSRKGVQTAPSNEAFDVNLKSRNPQWGIRDLENDLLPLAEQHSLTLEHIIDMPANNFSLIFVKQ